MIGYLNGTIKNISGNEAIINVNGVGYSINLAGLEVLPNQQVEVFVYTHVREQEISLFGFKNTQDLDIFKKLISVSGVGPKSALALIDTYEAGGVVNAILSENPAGLKVSGIGGKTSEKIILELKSKLKGYQLTSGNIINLTKQKGSGKLAEVSEALSSLGYAEQQINSVLNELEIDESQSVQDIVKMALKSI